MESNLIDGKVEETLRAGLWEFSGDCTTLRPQTAVPEVSSVREKGAVVITPEEAGCQPMAILEVQGEAAAGGRMIQVKIWKMDKNDIWERWLWDMLSYGSSCPVGKIH